MNELKTVSYSFVDLAAEDGGVVSKTLREPHGEFLLGVLNAVRSVDDVASNLDAVHATDAAGVRLLGVGGTNDLASLLDDILTLEGNGNNGAADNVLNQRTEEGLGREVRVVTLSKLLGDVHELEATESVALGQEAVEDGGNQVALDAIRLNHDVSGLQIRNDIYVEMVRIRSNRIYLRSNTRNQAIEERPDAVAVAKPN
jgi:hypothetical protein